MYSYEDRVKAVEIYIKYDKNMSLVIRELGYPSRQMLYLWYKEFTANGRLQDNSHSSSKYSAEQRNQAIVYYQAHGRSIPKTIKALGYPARTTFRSWLKEDLPYDEKHCVVGKSLIRCTQEQKESAVIRLCTGDGSPKEIAEDFGVAESSLYTWKKRLLSEGCEVVMPNNKSLNGVSRKEKSAVSIDELTAEREALEKQVEDLQGGIHRLQLEYDILEKTGELLKKGQGISPKTLTNREKTILIDALREKYKLKELLGLLSIAKSSYCYQRCALQRPDKYAQLRSMVKDTFASANSCYGYRRSSYGSSLCDNTDD